MKVSIVQPPFGSAFEEIIPKLYAGAILPIKQSQPYSTDHLEAGILLHENEGLIARIALYDNPLLQLDGQQVLSLGAYECVDDAEASQTLLNAVLDYAKTNFPNHVLVGPMDGSTWQTYRFVTSGVHQPPFLLEPFALPYYPAQWQAAGFVPLMQYVSNLAHFDESHRTDTHFFQHKFEEKGLIFRHLDVSDQDAELRRLAKFNFMAFQSAFLYSPISEADFMEKNRKTMAFLQPELVHLALDGPDICALILAYPDRLDPAGKTAVVKTLARLPGEKYRGLGDLLCAKIVSSLLDNGYQTMIHALMRLDNASNDNSSRFWGEKYKEYSLFQLKPPR